MGRKTPDLSNQTFGRLKVVARVPREPGTPGEAMWMCQCECGNLVSVGSSRLRNGHTRSCGCLQREVTIARSTKHGLAPRSGRPRAYSSWANMIRRCTKTDDPRYPNWGGRGITVDPRWLKFENFLADMGERPPRRTLNRKDNDGPYTKLNCEWSTPHEQMVNSSLFKLTPDVVTEIAHLRASGLSLSEIGRQVGLHRGTVSRALTGKGRSRKGAGGHAADNP